MPENHATPDRLRTTDFARGSWHLTAPAGMTLEDVTAPAFWKLIANRVRPQDLVEVHAEDASWFARLYVRQVVPQAVRVHVLEHVVFSAEEPEALPGAQYAAAWKGPHRLFAVVSVADGSIVKDGFPTREAAQIEARDFERNAA